MTLKVTVFPNEQAAQAALSRTRAAAHAVARRATNVHPAARHLVPESWDGQGEPPPGWSVPYGVEREPGSTRVAIVVEADFARDKPDFADARDRLPDDWKRGEDDVRPEPGDTKPDDTKPVEGGGRT